MGTLSCAGAVVELDDRVLTHLQVVIMRKLRRGEAFVLSWVHGTAIGSGRSSVWVSPSQPVRFRFADPSLPTIDEAWLARLAESADGPRGLVVVDEHGGVVRSGAVPHPAEMPRRGAGART